MAENQVYLIKSGQNSFVEETQAIVGISGGKVGIGTTVPEADFHVAGHTQIDGDLTVKGNFTTVESTTIQVDDKNIELGVGSTSDAAADGGGITLHGATNKTFNWVDATDAWTSSEHLYLANGKHFSADELRALDADGLKLADQTTSGILIKGGKVGIHQTSPAYDLDVAGSGNFASLYIQGNSVLTGDGSIFGKWEDGATAGEIYYNEGNVGVGTIDPSAQLHVVGSTLLNGNVSASGINAIDANGLILGDDGGNGIFVEDGGQVGVNTITPNYNLHVNGTAHVGDNFSVGGDISGSAIKAIDANGLTLGDDAGNGIFVEDGGQVGIGTTAPGYSLDVVGNGNFSQGLYVNGNSVLTGSAADLGKWDEGANSKIFYSAGNVGVGTSDPSVKFEVVGDSLFNGDLSVGSAFSVSTNGSVGGILPTSAGQVVGWDGSKWRPITSAGGGGSSSEVPEAFVQSLASGQSEYTINFTQTYDSAPAISTDLQIDGAGDIIPYAISEVTTSGYSISFAKDLPNNNYKIHTNFGGRDVFWTTGALGSINYSGGDVSIQDSLSVGANLTVQGNAVLTGSAADLGKWDEGAGSEIYYSDGNVGVGTSNPSYTLHVNGTIYNENGGLNVANKFNVSTLGAVGGQSPAFNEVIKWDGSKWIAGSAPGGGTASSSEVPSAFDTWLAAGSTLHPITFVDAPEGGYQSIPSISTDVEIVDGDIIPYAISGVSTTGYYAVFSDPIPTSNNYKIHTTFGGKEVYWKTGAGGSSIYYDGDSVSVDDLVVGGNLTVNGTTTTVNTQTVEIEDHNLVIAANTGYNQLTSEYPGAGGAYAGILWGTGDAGAASPVKLTYQTNKGFAFEGGNVGIGTTNPTDLLTLGTADSGTSVISFRTDSHARVSEIKAVDTGSGDGQLSLWTRKTGTSYQRITIDSAGNVGIGTTNPGAKLDVKNSSNTEVTSRFYNGGGSAPATVHIVENGNAGDHVGLFVGADDLSSAVLITKQNNVGIGTTNPYGKLHVQVNTDTYASFNYASNGFGGTTSDEVALTYSNKLHFGAVNSSNNPQVTMSLLKDGNVGIGTTSPITKLQIDGGNTSNSTYAFSAYGSSSAAAKPSVQMCFDNGSSSYTMVLAKGSRSNGYLLGAFDNSNAFCFQMLNSGNLQNTNNSYGQLSDIKLKENVADATPKLDDLNKVRVVNFNFKGDDLKQIGVVAQELEEIFPGLVDDVPDHDEDGNLLETTTKSVKYSVFGPILIKAIQEQQSIIEDLKSQNASLAAQNADFESRISQLEQ